MNSTENRMLEVVTLSTIVIALSSFGLLSLEMINTFEWFLFPLWAKRIMVSAISLLSLYYTAISVVKFHSKK